MYNLKSSNEEGTPCRFAAIPLKGDQFGIIIDINLFIGTFFSPPLGGLGGIQIIVTSVGKRDFKIKNLIALHQNKPNK